MLRRRQIGRDAVADQLLACPYRQSRHMQRTHQWKDDITATVNQISQWQITVAAYHTLSAAYHQVKGFCGIRVGGVHGNGEFVTRHDPDLFSTIITHVQGVCSLQIDNLLRTATTG